MSLKIDILPFLDKFGMVTPNRDGRSDNGVMYTSEYLLLLTFDGELLPEDKAEYLAKMERCLIRSGRGAVLMRDPENDGESQEGPDDYLGLLAGCRFIGNTEIPRAILWHGLTHFGAFNNVAPFGWTRQSWLWRQPQLITQALFAAKLPVGPFRLFFILSLLYAVYQNAPKGNTDARRLGWLLIQAWDGKGLLSRWVVGVWKRWLFSKYPDGMIGVARIYYCEGHPFTAYIPEFYAPSA